jgi:hypothetical protein
MLTTVVTGIYMWLTVWRGTAWMLVVLGALVLEIVIFVTLTIPRMAAMEQALAAEKRPISQTFHNLANNPVLWISVQTRLAIILGIVFLKIAKPDLVGSLLTIGVSILLGLAVALPALRRVRVQEGPAD